jgi:hypothetical protein
MKIDLLYSTYAVYPKNNTKKKKVRRRIGEFDSRFGEKRKKRFRRI